MLIDWHLLAIGLWVIEKSRSEQNNKDRISLINLGIGDMTSW